MPKSKVAFRSKIFRLGEAPITCALEVPKKVVEDFGGGYKRRYVCSVEPGSKKGKAISFSCAVMALGEGKGVVFFSKKRMKDCDLREGDRPKVVLEVDESKYGMPVPGEWKALLKQDKLGRERFDALSPGKQRYVLHHVGGVKSPILRLERAMRVMENLKRLPRGGGSYREMFGIGKEGAAPSTERPKDLKVVEFSELVGPPSRGRR
jgi:hypothetical protein